MNNRKAGDGVPDAVGQLAGEERITVTPPDMTQDGDLHTWFACMQFLQREAELLDDNRIDDWFALIDPEIDYRVPIRTTRERVHGGGFSADGYHMLEDYNSLATRVERLSSEYAWAEDPPSHTRRLVTNVRVGAADRDGLHVRSNLLICRARYDQVEYQLLAGERHDVLRRTASGLRLGKRLVLLDQTSLHTHNLAIFL
jgi:3-phenylpropionate/cinnamic acid dioxygenase small subunit